LVVVFGVVIYGVEDSGVSTIGINEEQIRQYVRWQEKKERDEERLQGELFDKDRED
jgi:hypothetical protein